MRRPTFKPRYIKPEQILIGDTVRISETQGKVVYSAVGTVAKRERVQHGTTYHAEDNRVIGTHFRDGIQKLTVTLLAPSEARKAIPLEGLENV